MDLPRLKVYGWVGLRRESAGNGETREIIAARSKAEAGRIAGDPEYVSIAACETDYSEEINVANTRPGMVLWRPLHRLYGGWNETR